MGAVMKKRICVSWYQTVRRWASADRVILCCGMKLDYVNGVVISLGQCDNGFSMWS